MTMQLQLAQVQYRMMHIRACYCNHASTKPHEQSEASQDFFFVDLPRYLSLGNTCK